MTKLQKLRKALAEFDERAMLASGVTPEMVWQTRQRLLDDIAKLEAGAKAS